MMKKWLKRGIYLAFIPLAASGCHRGHGGSATAEQAQERVKHAAEWFYAAVDATDEQEAAIDPLLEGATGDLFEMRAERQALAQELRTALSRDTVDPAELEQIRGRALALIERASQRGFEALAQVAEQLDAEQRNKLVKRWEKRAKRHGG